MSDFLNKFTKPSPDDQGYPAHQPGATCIYKSKDGLKYYAIVEREDRPMDAHQIQYYQSIGRNDTTYPIVKVRLISNPALEVSMRKPIREMHPCYLRVIDVGNWLEYQKEFIKELRDATKEAVQYHK